MRIDDGKVMKVQIVIFANCQLPTANCQLPTANCQLTIAYCVIDKF